MDYIRLTDAQLIAMSLDDLNAYSQTVSTAVGLQYSSIAGDEIVQSQYEYMILTSESTINGLGYEIMVNDNAIIASELRYAQLESDNNLLDSTINSYISSIDVQDKIIADSKRKAINLVKHSIEIMPLETVIDDDLAESDAQFISSAIGYSSLYMTFMINDILYQDCLSEISTTSSLYDASVILENIELANLEESTMNFVERSMELSSLFLEGNQIESTLAQYIIDETLATAALTSTNAGIIAISSMYETALITQQYYESLSTQTATIDAYIAAQSTVATAERRAEERCHSLTGACGGCHFIFL